MYVTDVAVPTVQATDVVTPLVTYICGVWHRLYNGRIYYSRN